MKLRKISIFKI